MKILIAEDDSVSRKLLNAHLTKWGYEIIVACDGREAWNILKQADSPGLAILDWMMPEIDGIELCKKIRSLQKETYTYIILLTAKKQKEDIITGLDFGADDYITKPFDPNELNSRVKSGIRILDLEHELAEKIRELKDALDHVKRLQGLLPICMYCKKIRDDTDTWKNIENYIEEHSDAMFTHSICRECRQEHYPDLMAKTSKS
ncbi:MAG: response regulator [Candidatus Zixiibacteriota bacterium]|nr:MAG: response regulator [candidate division Zixibacteria bacterium]